MSETFLSGKPTVGRPDLTWSICSKIGWTENVSWRGWEWPLGQALSAKTNHQQPAWRFMTRSRVPPLVTTRRRVSTRRISVQPVTTGWCRSYSAYTRSLLKSWCSTCSLPCSGAYHAVFACMCVCVRVTCWPGTSHQILHTTYRCRRPYTTAFCWSSQTARPSYVYLHAGSSAVLLIGPIFMERTPSVASRPSHLHQHLQTIPQNLSV